VVADVPGGGVPEDAPAAVRQRERHDGLIGERIAPRLGFGETLAGDDRPVLDRVQRVVAAITLRDQLRTPKQRDASRDQPLHLGAVDQAVNDLELLRPDQVLASQGTWERNDSSAPRWVEVSTPPAAFVVSWPSRRATALDGPAAGPRTPAARNATSIAGMASRNTLFMSVMRNSRNAVRCTIPLARFTSFSPGS